MTEQPDETREIADDGSQEDAGADGGRGASYGPSGSVGGEQEPGGEAPPYDGRTEGAPVKTDDSDYRDGVRVGGATGPVQSSGDGETPDPSDTPGGATGSPSDEQPAGEQDWQPDGSDPRDDPGVGPSHEAGTGRAEN
jgi:hypothetical protein